MSRYSYLSHLACVSCGRTFDAAAGVMTCPDCGEIRGTLDVLYDLKALGRDLSPRRVFERREPTHRRYHELLPVSDEKFFVPLPVGMTPLVPVEFEAGGERRSLWVKDDGRNPSGSLKDRASSIAVARAREGGDAPIACASTGNAASSLAAVCARAGRPCFVFVPRTAPVEKLTQLLIYGARVFTVDGTYDDAFDLAMKVCARFGFYNRNTAVNPFLGEGKKTAALEVWEQLGGAAPDAIFVPVGDGCIISGVYKGLRDLTDLGWIDRMPRIIGVQAEGSSAIAGAWTRGDAACDSAYSASTIADSISVSIPRDQVKALRAVRETKGKFVTVSDGEILAAMETLARSSGIFAEPAASASVAGFLKAAAAGDDAAGGKVVLLVTGFGLKDVKSARSAVRNAPVPIRLDIEEVARIITGGKGG